MFALGASAAPREIRSKFLVALQGDSARARLVNRQRILFPVSCLTNRLLRRSRFLLSQQPGPCSD